MTREQMDFLKEFKTQGIKLLIAYFFVSIGMAATFYIDTKIEIGKLKEGQELIKARQTETAHQVTKIVEMHLK